MDSDRVELNTGTGVCSTRYREGGEMFEIFLCKPGNRTNLFLELSQYILDEGKRQAETGFFTTPKPKRLIKSIRGSEVIDNTY